MAEKHKDIDSLFWEKLDGHSVNPSPMAWKNLEGRLSQKKKKTIPWMRIAASLLLLVGLTALLWPSVRNTQEELETLADKEPALEVIQEPAVEEIPSLKDVEEKELPIQKEPSVKKVAQIPAKQNLAVTKPAEPARLIRESEPVQEVKEIELPPLDTELLVAETIIVAPDGDIAQEVSYKVTIISKGIKTTPEKETLVGEIENKIEKIGGLIGKVDQGFADLQDAKNNLFASITTKKDNK